MPFFQRSMFQLFIQCLKTFQQNGVKENLDLQLTSQSTTVNDQVWFCKPACAHLYIQQLLTTSKNLVTEKWTKSYRHFSHGDTDTNMYLERYKVNV